MSQELRLLISIFSIISVYPLSIINAQSTEKASFTKWKTHVNVGSSALALVSYDHFLFSGDVEYHSQIKNSKWEWVALFQTNYAYFQPDPNSENFVSGYEQGMQLMFLWHFYNGRDRDGWYVQAGSGPHYISKAMERQAKGFLFANAFYLGYAWNSVAEIRVGIRHLSNAEIKLPNGGINNALLSLGINF